MFMNLNYQFMYAKLCFSLMKLANMSEEEIYKKYIFANNNDSEKTNRKALYKMLVDIEKIDSSIPYNNYYLNYFE